MKKYVLVLEESDMVNVAVDAMGGDNAPVEIVKGAIEAVKESKSVKVFLVGQEIGRAHV